MLLEDALIEFTYNATIAGIVVIIVVVIIVVVVIVVIINNKVSLTLYWLL